MGDNFYLCGIRSTNNSKKSWPNPDQSLIQDSERGEMGNNCHFFRAKYMYVLTPVVVEGIQNGDHSIQTWPVAFVALKALQTHPSEV